MEEKKYGSVVIIDDHPAVLLGLKITLKQIFNVIYTATNPEAGLKLVLENKPDLAVLDYHFANTTGDIVCKEIKYHLPKTKVMALSFDMEEEVVNKLFSVGINGFMLKSYHEEDLLRCILYILDGTDYFCREAKVHLMNRISFTDYNERVTIDGIEFTKNELETIRLISQQKSTREISELLFLSEKTIELYRSNIMKKTGAKNIVGIIKFALLRGIIKLSKM